MTLARRCLDLADLLAAATVGPTAVAVVAAGLHRLDGTAVARLQHGGVRLVGVVESDADAVRLADLGVPVLVRAPAPDDAHSMARFPSQVLAAVVAPAVGAGQATAVDELPGAGTVVAVWGPTGAPGRTSVAMTVADELARSGVSTLLADADTYGPSVAQRFGILDEASGVATAVRLANAGRLDAAGLADAARSLPSGLRRPDRADPCGPLAGAAGADAATGVVGLPIGRGRCGRRLRLLPRGGRRAVVRRGAWRAATPPR